METNYVLIYFTLELLDTEGSFTELKSDYCCRLKSISNNIMWNEDIFKASFHQLNVMKNSAKRQEVAIFI